MIRASIFWALAVIVAGAQTPSSLPQFEVASVKGSGPQSKRGSAGGPGTSDPGQYSFHQATFLDLIATAYHVDYFQISGKVPLDRDRFDVTAKVPEGATRDQFRGMMRTLLAERFHLQAHMESREFPAWELIIAKGGPKLRESSVPAGAEAFNERPQIGGDGFPVLPSDRPGYAARFSVADGFIIGRIAAQQQPVSILARGGYGGDTPPIVDKTGLTGKYDFRLEFSRDLPGARSEASVPPVPDLMAAIQQQLGLQFVPRKLSFDVVVVDSIDRTPVEN
jgi:uncharacterized protein (TIGR03435 family)